MDLLTLILACSLHFDDALVRALIQKVSLSNHLFVGDTATLKTYDSATSVAEAIVTVNEISSHGGRPAVGLMAIPTTWAARYGRTTAELFDSCTNIAIGTAALSAYAAECEGPKRPGHSLKRTRRRIPTASVRACILTKMGADVGLIGYPQGILPELARLEASEPDRSVDPPTARSQLYPDDTDHSTLNEAPDWSNPRLYFAPLPPPAPPLGVQPNTTPPGPSPALRASPPLPPSKR